MTDGPPFRADHVGSLLRPANPAVQRANNTKAREVLGWAPTMQFEEIVAAMVRHHLAVLNRST